jgi:hypothetical protein
MTLHRTNTSSRALIAFGLTLSVALFSACGGRSGNTGAPTSDPVRSAFGPGTSSSPPGSGGSTGSQATNTQSPVATGNPKSGSAALQEPGSDALKYGTAPAYAEIQAAAIRGASRSISFTLTVAAELPDKTPDAATTMRSGFRVKAGEIPYVLSANVSSTGWTTTATKDGKSVTFPGTLKRNGATLTIVVPWTFFGGPQTFTWTGFAAWEQAATTRFYSVDIIPNAGEAAFPQS